MANFPGSVIPVILSGGAGTRLWPVSNETMPKQFLTFGSEHSLIQNTLLRCKGPRFDDRPIVVSLESQRQLIAEHARQIGVEADIVLEPLRRDSCAAVLSGALLAMRRNPNALVLILAADHHISEPESFRDRVVAGCAAAEAGYIVTFGVKPTYPATGYGYILSGDAIASTECFVLERFVEKPTFPVAEGYLRQGFLWNSGNFLARADVLIAEARSHVPDVITAAEAALAVAKTEPGVVSLDADAYAKSPRISLDYGIMEKTNRSAVLPVSYGWNDIGTWDSVAGVLSKDASSNAIHGSTLVKTGSGNIIYAQGVKAVVHGLDDVIVVATPEAVLVMKKGGSEAVKALVADLEKAGQKP
jgi:mannose-1-phosphate guanylyltransferase / mannose-6-phosphate isomerase